MMNKFLRFTKFDVYAILLIILSSFVLLLDTIIYRGQPANMDGVVHITNSAIFYDALSSGDFPVRWTDGFANYGLPMGSFAQQLTSYMGGFLTFLTHNVIISFNIVYVIGSILSVLLFYIFLRFYFKTWPSFVGAFVFNFAPYRIINLYIRGAIPEYFSSVFFVLILIFLYLLIEKKIWWSYLGLALSILGIILSHPMTVVTSSIFIAPYFLFLLKGKKNKLKIFLLSASSILLGVLLSSYYLIPLLKDIKYFYYGSSSNHYNPSFLGVKNFFDSGWYYFLIKRNEILSRGHFIKTGLLESLLMIGGFIFVIIERLKKRKISILDVSVFVGLVSLFLTTKYADIFYKKIDLLSNIQFPWRMLSTYIFIPPIITAFLISKLKNKSLLIVLSTLIIVAIAWNRFPELYGKNFTLFPQKYYSFTVDNLHTSNMNTIWTAQTTSYPVKRKNKVAILEGEARISDTEIKNSQRKYKISASSRIRMIDYTFYFPGWKVFVDKKEVPIEFQDINNRGVITYFIPEGEHNVEVIFQNTKTVKLANYLSVFGFIIIAMITLFNKKLKVFLFDKTH